MKIAVLGTDGRYAYLRGLLGDNALTSDAGSAELIITPWPTPVEIPDAAMVVTCGPGNGPDGSIDLLLDEEYQLDIAWMTAEGAVSAAMRESKRALRGAYCMVVGWGRIGKEVTELLVGMGAKVMVASRRSSVCAEVWARGAEWIPVDEIKNAVGSVSFVFSTSPVMTIDAGVLNNAGSDAVIIDLASAPYGVDVEAAKEIGVMAWREPGLPGRYCPENAGRAIYDALVRRGLLKEAGNDE